MKKESLSNKNIEWCFLQILQRSQAVLAGTLHVDHYRPAVSFQHAGFPLGWHALKAHKMIKGYEGYFPNQALVPSVLLPYKEKNFEWLIYSRSWRERTRISKWQLFNACLIFNQGIDLIKHLNKLSIKLLTNFLYW